MINRLFYSLQAVVLMRLDVPVVNSMWGPYAPPPFVEHSETICIIENVYGDRWAKRMEDVQC